jgi:hypothetical protein
MLSCVLLCGLLSAGAGEDGKLEIVHPRATFGHLGAVRPKGVGILPGDVAHFSFEVNNLKHDDKGQSSYSIAVEVRDGSGELFYKQEPFNSVAQNFFGGNSLPCSASLEIPLNAKPGIYSWKVTIHDRLADKSTSVAGKGEVRQADFGLIRVGTYADADGKVPVAPVGVVGSTMYVSFAAVGFGRTKTDKQPDLAVEMKILDENGKTTFAKPITGRVQKDIPESLKIIPLQYGVTLNRPGRFTVELTARCELCGKSATVSLPVRIVAME